MGDLHVNGVVFGEDRPCASSPPSPPLPPSNPDPSSVSPDAWSAAEKTTAEILRRIRPTVAADRRRREVVDYVQRLIRSGARCEVFPYGSVPLKTYLPDGDIDLTALSYQNVEDGLVSEVHAVLQEEEINEAAEYEVKDVRFIDAEVKLVKCIVQNIVVDISFNQLGGLSTLCFLEKVDRLVAKDHLFKRSIILIKAWCYYESRVLGAHHGLISTYALETLVLYIFHQFHVSLDGPLAVLYRFLDYFSKFDWDNYCVSLKGPVSKTSLPNIVAEVPENGGNTLLTEEFIRSCVESFSVPSRGLDLNLRAFSQKHLNIIDPLKENNNLGRSVNKGNFYRIRSAFKYGARKLGWILMLPEDRIADELNKFFANTLVRHGNAQGNEDKSFLCLSTGSIWKPGNQHNYETRNEKERYAVKDVPSLAGPLFDSSWDGNAVASFKFREDSKDVPTSEVLDIASTGGLSYCSNGKFESSLSSGESFVNSVIDDEKEKHGMASNSPGSHTDEKNIASYGLAVSKDAIVLENSFFNSDRPTSVSEGTEGSKSLLDLTGDYDSHIGNLQYGQMCNGYTFSPVVVPSPPRSPKFQNRNPWETVRQCLQINHSIHSQTNSNCVMGQQLYVINHPTLPMAFGPEEKRKLRGTGAYFPNMTSRSYRDNRPIPGRGRGQAPGIHGHIQRHTRNSGMALAPQETNLSAEGTFEHTAEGYPALGSTKTRSSETYFSQPSTWGSRYANGIHSTEIHESGSMSPQLPVLPRTEVSNYPDSGISPSRGTVPNTGAVTEERSNPLSLVDSKRVEVQAYHLKNEDDFPPLSH
ncbi:uncharacterized protein LOC113846460 isoform X2 [Abrus precatorius]|uniref:Uncharacterized protein LOC113846460 isoform X2 n=1 Tax=Abrus precatorius TaxID=3816 RepID=A0A8B8JGI7_ABRPR|nr:uncharacterized protein LOC113846460 isoform X2 [Abrus precatorius]XP_027330566.1 uncharacterized protein LOC113846460 isoform X2 [Abrus precatorius]